jgi:hypothetical protein
VRGGAKRQSSGCSFVPRRYLVRIRIFHGHHSIIEHLSHTQHKDRRIFVPFTNTPRLSADATKRRPAQPHLPKRSARDPRRQFVFTPAELWPTLFHLQLLLLTSHTFFELPLTGPTHSIPAKHGRHRFQPRGLPRQCHSCGAGEEAGPRDRLHHPRDGGWFPGEHTRESLQG